MNWKRYIYVGVLFLMPALAKAQYIQGTVLDISHRYTIPFVNVYSTSGNATMTDSVGFYSIPVVAGDSIWFSYLGKFTHRYAVNAIPNKTSFDISIQKSAIELPEVILRKRDYRTDSIRNREEFAKIFDYKRSTFQTSTLSDASMGAGVGLDLTALLNSFNVKRNRSMRITQSWMIKEEQDKYVEYRFSKELIQKLTHIYDEEELAVFIKYYKPDFELVANWNDAELGQYILECVGDFKKKNRFRGR